MFHEQVGIKIKTAFQEATQVLSARSAEVENLKDELTQREEIGSSAGLENLLEEIDLFNSRLKDVAMAIRNQNDETMIELAEELEKSGLPDLASFSQKRTLFKEDICKVQKMLTPSRLEKRLDEIYEVCVDGLNYDVAKVLAQA